MEPVDVAVAGEQLGHAVDGVVVAADVELHVRQRGQTRVMLWASRTLRGMICNVRPLDAVAR